MSRKVTATRAPEVSVSTTPSACRATALTSPAARHAARACVPGRQKASAASRAMALGVRNISAEPRRPVGRGRFNFDLLHVGVLAAPAAEFAELLHLAEELAALLLGRQPVALALLLLPADGLHKLGLVRHAVAEAGRRAAGFEAGAHEDVVLDEGGEAVGARLAGDRLVQA